MISQDGSEAELNMSLASDDQFEANESKERAVNPTPKRGAAGGQREDKVESDQEVGPEAKKDKKRGSPELVSPKKRWRIPENEALANEHKNE